MKYKFSTKSDVWAFGVVVWEIFEFGKVPYFGMSNAEVGGFINSGQRLSKPAKCPEDLYQLVQQCWHIDPQFRPNFDEIYEALAQMTRPQPAQPVEPPVVTRQLRADTHHNTTYKAIPSMENLLAHSTQSNENANDAPIQNSQSEPYNNERSQK
mmetsp:Transcript_8392/g.11577  ORF Transcript_8392/g.11577 Transcript_8392/m.11577 type:complete len:154 (-) Transcript_8392:139-600(-)